MTVGVSFSASAQADIDTVAPLSPNAIKEVIKYKALDSVAMNLDSRHAFLYTEGSIDYGKMILKADQVRVDFNHQTLFAHGTYDTAGNIQGRPFFKQDDAEYHADTITFNYNTQKGIIQGVITQEGDGYLHGNKVKKINDSIMYLSGGSYTTCNYSAPHFAINFTKSKLITNDKIVTGPAWLTVENVPTPVALPFAFFPLNKTRQSGILIPSYGWMNYRGYYLRDGGYYFAINDNIDLSLTGELYTNLSWAIEGKSNYYKRYKYKGAVDARMGQTFEGIRGDPYTFNSFNDFKITWQHDQDPKANPYSRFSANVNLQSRNYNKNTTNRNDYFNSTTTSSINYSTKIGSYLNLSASARESFNAQTGVMNIKLPSISLSSITIYPLRRRTPLVREHLPLLCAERREQPHHPRHRPLQTLHTQPDAVWRQTQHPPLLHCQTTQILQLDQLIQLQRTLALEHHRAQLRQPDRHPLHRHHLRLQVQPRLQCLLLPFHPHLRHVPV